MKYEITKIVSFISIIFCSFLVNIECASAQELKLKNKNTAYVSYGNIIFSNQVSVACERSIVERKRMQTRWKLNYGNYLTNNADYETGARVYNHIFGVSVVQLIRWLEINVGVAYARYQLERGFNPEPDIDYSVVQEGIVLYRNVGVR